MEMEKCQEKTEGLDLVWTKYNVGCYYKSCRNGGDSKALMIQVAIFSPSLCGSSFCSKLAKHEKITNIYHISFFYHSLWNWTSFQPWLLLYHTGKPLRLRGVGGGMCCWRYGLCWIYPEYTYF